MGYVRLNGSYNILKSINFQVAGIPSLCKEKNMNMKSMSYTGKVLWTVWELDVEDYEILLTSDLWLIFWGLDSVDTLYVLLTDLLRRIQWMISKSEPFVIYSD